MEIRGIGPTTARLCILVDYPRTSALANRAPLGDWELRFLNDKLIKNGINPADVRIESLLASPGDNKEWALGRFINRAADLPNCTTLVTLGETSMRATSLKYQLDKWHCSPLDAIDVLPVRKVMPTFHPERIQKEWRMNVWMDVALQKAVRHLDEREWERKDYAFELNPPVDHTLSLLEEIARKDVLAVDIETGRGQINTVGFAWSPREALAIRTLPGSFAPEPFYQLWDAIRRVLEGPAKKVMQNGIYEAMYFSMYGINIENYWHDTMWCNKLLWPELEKGLDSVGRIYTMEPYWKDEGKTTTAEGKKKDWGNIRDWESHLRYNCKDTTGTFEAYLGQTQDLESRGIRPLWDNYIRRFAEPLQEMCMRGLPISETDRRSTHERIEQEIGQLTSDLSQDINPRSPKQKLELFHSKGYKIPKVRNSKGKWAESTNELSLKKLRLKHPEDDDLRILIELSSKMKALSAYVDCTYDEDGFIRYMFDGHGTETGRFSCNSDHRYRGFNAQTIPKYAKKFIKWPEDEDRVFVCCDLKQAESRFVAYDSADTDLIEMLEDSSKDIHRYVAAEIFQKPESEIVHSERQLGKKSGHGANYSMKETTFMESCLKEMDLVLTKSEAENVLESYHRLFPGIRRWHGLIREEVRQSRRLSNPLGRVRYFYDRMDDSLFREAYAYRPQSTVPDITNHLMLGLYDARSEGQFDFWFHLQVHDSVVVSCRRDEVPGIAAYMLDIDKWHPEIVLRAGRLRIPTEVEVGKSLGDTEVFEGEI